MRNLMLLCLMALAYTLPLTGQQILLDKPISAGELILFPDLNNENEFYYMPNKIQIGKHADGKPMFSFIKYARSTDGKPGNTNVVTETDQAGGIVHAVVSLEVTPDQKKQAEQSLRRLKSAGKIMGPIIFKSGTVALISSFNKEGENVKKVVGLGTAPILEGQKAAMSVLLNKEGADILWATFQTPTPDFSISFEMEVAGFLSPKRATISANWDRIYSHEAFEAAVASPILSGEIKTAFDELKDSGAISVTQVGEDEKMDKLIETAYNQLTNLMFDKIAGSGVPDVKSLFPGQDKSMLDRATENLQHYRKEALDNNARADQQETQRMRIEQQARTRAQQARDRQMQERGEQFVPPTGGDSGSDTSAAAAANPPKRMDVPSMSIALSYQMKKEKRSGNFTINLNKYTSDTRMNRFDENFGNYISQSKCPSCFKRVLLDDPLYKQREVHVRVDGSISAEDFGKYINSVEITMRKKHENGQITLKGLQIDKKAFSEQGNDFVMQYGWQGDDNREKWLEYEYMTKWSFFGGNVLETPWQKTETSAFGLAPELVRKPIYVEAEPDFFEKEKIRSAEVKIFYTVNNKPMTEKVVIKAKDGEMSKTLDVAMLKANDAFDYEIAYFIKGQDVPKIMAKKTTSYGRIYLENF